MQVGKVRVALAKFRVEFQGIITTYFAPNLDTLDRRLDKCAGEERFIPETWKCERP